MYIDLHTHTTASDGQYSPSEVIKMAKEKGIERLAITDHDTVSGLSMQEKARSDVLILHSGFRNMGMWLREKKHSADILILHASKRLQTVSSRHRKRLFLLFHITF